MQVVCDSMHLKTVLRRKRDWPRKIEEMPEERLVKTVYVEGMAERGQEGEKM